MLAHGINIQQKWKEGNVMRLLKEKEIIVVSGGVGDEPPHREGGNGNTTAGTGIASGEDGGPSNMPDPDIKPDQLFEEDL